MSKPESAKIAQVEVHPLLTREVRPIYDWAEWLERWQQATSFNEMLGLLHSGFDVTEMRHGKYGVKEYDYFDRVEFYFSIADGWTDRYALRREGDKFGEKEKKFYVGYDKFGNAQQKTESELRQALARKAFDMLCANFFRLNLREESNREDKELVWMKRIVEERIFPIIQNFFRFNEGMLDGHGIRNLSRYGDEQSHNQKHAIDFLTKLPTFIWGWEEARIESWDEDEKKVKQEKHNEMMRTRVDGAKPWIIEVLSQLDKLQLLKKWILDLDKPCLGKLKEIAMRKQFNEYPSPVSETRRVATIDEACYLGSSAGWFLKEYELRKTEHKRLLAIMNAERKREESVRELERLTKSTEK